MSFCTVDQVKSAINFPATGAPVSDADIQLFIDDSEEEIEDLYKTKFGNVEFSGTPTSGSTTTIVQTGANYTIDQYVDYVVWVYSGTNAGEYRPIITNTIDTLTISPAFSSAIDVTSLFRITKLGYKSENIDGTGVDFMHTNYQPLIILNALTIDSVAVTPSKVFQYNFAARLLLNTTAEVSIFNNNTPKLVDLEYIYGVYPIPKIIQRLCVIISGIRTLTAQIAGTYDDFTAITLPGGLTGSKGEPYVNIQSSLNYMMGEARGIVYGTEATGQVTADFRTGSSYATFALFS